ncbi:MULTISPECIES: C-terminal binding protein [Bifidobacterium]|jgi:phosphoglycerate dehydrogenase-like enzyme|uniref:C-terminal binding protein n=1 Tax=Bifidobacterium tibiigranuli TaxID=2172043 RepID=A0A5N6S4F2_9BIFI|nr:C-terminal binding protein [Bifidobacterium tibiigranuli]KAE8129207.1 C-terminal binding protein [Bifidobacterium tibiigranuli]KAE8129445.1 C-terminal binding protein [Bifidobacterium tibiigranuli]MCH3975418.1 C-terminal binding protein [Bifidobacterium tibiigranuli]MCH4189684.1 C-terminal binding protein [Bifidobacterium tibiigranuli]MCH4204223.1 C-terminal binding protein [Bifidobacterium tibiigranuli]
MAHLVWVIDEEWADYDAETAALRAWDPNVDIRFSGYDYATDLDEFGTRADLILAQVYAPLPATTVDRLECCKGIALFGGGYDRVDVETAARRGIPVTNVHGYCAEDLADYVLAAIFRHYKPLDGYTPKIAKGEWGAPALGNPPHRLSASTLLIVGCGRIGSTVAVRAGALGMHVIGYDPHRDAEKLAARGIAKVDDLHQALAQADYISVNARLCEETTGLLGAAEFDCCKPSALLVNTSRGKVLDEPALIAAVRSGHLAGAVLDVVADEPPSVDDPILHVPGIVVTPHVSYISIESFAELRERTVRNGIDMVEGGHPADIVNMWRCSSEGSAGNLKGEVSRWPSSLIL